VDGEERIRLLSELNQLAALTQESGVSGIGGEDAPIEGSRAVLLSDLAELVQAEILELWSEGSTPVTAPETLDALAAMHRLRSLILPDRESDVAARLAQPSGLDLIIEVAHDIRSPLTSILFLSEALRGGHSGEVNEVQRRQLGLIYSAALGLISIAGDVMELAKGGTRLPEESPAPFSVSEVFDSVREMVQPMAEEKGIVLRMVAPDQDHYLGHPTPLSRVLLNLTTNALKFTDQGFVEVEGRDVRRSLVLFSVRDTGRGMDPSEVENLYEPFRRASHRDGYLFSGTGLGLSIARRLVEAMGSRLEVESRRNWGTRFFFELELPLASRL
jgi:signal transduction histidine kinase